LFPTSAGQRPTSTARADLVRRVLRGDSADLADAGRLAEILTTLDHP